MTDRDTAMDAARRIVEYGVTLDMGPPVSARMATWMPSDSILVARALLASAGDGARNVAFEEAAKAVKALLGRAHYGGAWTTRLNTLDEAAEAIRSLASPPGEKQKD